MSETLAVQGVSREPVLLDGAAIRAPQAPTKYDPGFWGGVGIGWQTGALNFSESWEGLLEPEDPVSRVSEEYHKQVVGERKIPFALGTEKDQLRRAVNKYDRDQWLASQNVGVVSDLLGGMLPSIFTPDSLVGIAVGAGPAAFAYKAVSKRLFATALAAGVRPGLARQSVAAAAGSATELVVGSQATAAASLGVSEARTGAADVATAAAYAELPFTPLGVGLGVLGAGLTVAAVRPRLPPAPAPTLRPREALPGPGPRALEDSPIDAELAEIGPTEGITDTRSQGPAPLTYIPDAEVSVVVNDVRTPLTQQQIYDIGAADFGGVFREVEAPPPAVGAAKPLPPVGRIGFMFQNYPGGVQSWLRGVADESDQALLQAELLGIDIQPLRDLMQRTSQEQARTMRRSVDELRDLFNAAQKPAENIAQLRAAGMVDDAGQLLPPFQKLGPQQGQQFLGGALPKKLVGYKPEFDGRPLLFSDDVEKAAYVLGDEKAKSAQVKAALEYLESVGYTRDEALALTERVVPAAQKAARAAPLLTDTPVPTTGRAKFRATTVTDAKARTEFLSQGPEAMLLDAGLPVRTSPANISTAAFINALEEGRAFGTGKAPPENLLPPKTPKPPEPPKTSASAQTDTVREAARKPADKTKVQSAERKAQAAAAKEVEDALNDDPLRADMMDFAKKAGVDFSIIGKTMDDAIKGMKACRAA